jgi:DNA-binding Lrp family transcriptional regulator
MAIRAYVLIEVGIGKARNVVQALQKMKDVKAVDAVTGPYDVIALIEGTDMNSLGDLITREIHEIGGISRTVTCIAVKIS